jgi:hypothetical protein
MANTTYKPEKLLNAEQLKADNLLTISQYRAKIDWYGRLLDWVAKSKFNGAKVTKHIDTALQKDFGERVRLRQGHVMHEFVVTDTDCYEGKATFDAAYVTKYEIGYTARLTLDEFKERNQGQIDYMRQAILDLTAQLEQLDDLVAEHNQLIKSVAEFNAKITVGYTLKIAVEDK